VPRVPVLRAGFTQRFRGPDGGFQVSRSRPWSDLESTLAPQVGNYRAARANPADPSIRQMAATSLADALREVPGGADLVAAVRPLRGFFLADPEDLSVLAVVEQLVAGAPAQKAMFRIEGGSSRLVEALVRDTPATYLLRHELQAIEQRADAVIATVIDAAGRQQQLDADTIVVTLPASTLRDVAIAPALPDAQARAIRSLRYGNATKVTVQTARDPLAHRRARAFATDTAAGAFWDGSEGAPTSDRGLVTFLAGGHASRELRALIARGPRAVLAEPCWLGLASSVEASADITWEAEPWSRGGYAYFDPGFDPALRPELARPAGRIVFAGEHTSRTWQGYMNGAVESGVRAAREALEHLRTLRQPHGRP
jgi:monoamine oxidase